MGEFIKNTTPIDLMPCYGCGAMVENIPGQPHKYIGASQGCWNLYGQILALEYTSFQYPSLTHRLTVDTYAIQHPGYPGKQSSQSVHGHLLSLYFIFMKNASGKEATDKINQFLSKAHVYSWLEPPVPNGTLTVSDVLKSGQINLHEKLVREWAEDVWNCWYKLHKSEIDKFVSSIF